MKTYNFTIRIYQDKVNSPVLSGLQNITISNITLISKPSKYGEICFHKGNQKKFGYSIKLSKKFLYGAGSHSTPLLAFKGSYIDIIIENFPRYPVFTQELSAVRGCLKGYGYTNYLNQGFPHQLLYRDIKIITN